MISWDEDSFFARIANDRRPSIVRVARSIFVWMQETTDGVRWGKGEVYGSCSALLHHEGYDHVLFKINSDGSLDTCFQWHQRLQAFALVEKREALMARLNAISGIELPAEGINKRPPFDMKALINPDSLGQFLEAYEWMIAEVRRSELSGSAH